MICVVSHHLSSLFPEIILQLCERLSDELGVCKTEQIQRTESLEDDLESFDSGSSLPGF